MAVVTDLTGEDSDSDNNNDKTLSSTGCNTVTPNKTVKTSVQTTIEKAIMRGYSSGRLQSSDGVRNNNWDSHNTFCNSKFIYHPQDSFAAPAYDTTTISPTNLLHKACETNLQVCDVANIDDNTVDKIDTYTVNGKESATELNNEVATSLKSNIPCGINENTSPDSIVCHNIEKDPTTLMNAYI